MLAYKLAKLFHVLTIALFGVRTGTRLSLWLLGLSGHRRGTVERYVESSHLEDGLCTQVSSWWVEVQT